MAEPRGKERRLTVSTLREPRPAARRQAPKPDRVVPFLRLRGLWLSELGFAAGVKVAVSTERGRLVITPLLAEGAADG